MTLTREQKGLLVEIAIAAANHGLRQQAYALLPLFPELLQRREDRLICTSLLHFGLGESALALRTLAPCKSEAAEKLVSIFSGATTRQDKSLALLK